MKISGVGRLKLERLGGGGGEDQGYPYLSMGVAVSLTLILELFSDLFPPQVKRFLSMLES